ncbi:MAG TPA: hypothetical protein VN838_15585 [Bradyrhizobium sp.]|nr:hypothetical protein [Bradyrhizobium sp.]
MSLQFSILKVLAGQPDGRATVADLNRTITLLSVPEWTARMKSLSALAPDLDIFGSRYVVRDDGGWQLTEAGQDFLAAIEKPASATADQELAAIEVIMAPVAARRSSPRLRLVADNLLADIRAPAKDGTARARVA